MNLSSNQTNTKTDTSFFIVRGILLISVLLIFLVVLTIWGEAIDIDRRFSAQFFTTGDDWFLADRFPWNWLYDFGEAPGILFSILCFTSWIFFRTDPARAALRPYLLICALTPFIASLLMVNVVLANIDNWEDYICFSDMNQDNLVNVQDIIILVNIILS